MQPVNHLPLPYFLINEELEILERSDSAKALFDPHPHLLSLVDEESKSKITRYIRPDSDKPHLEANLITNGSALHLFDIYQQWDLKSGQGHLACVLQDPKIQAVAEQLLSLREQIRLEGLQPPRPPQPEMRTVELALHAATIRDLFRIIRPVVLDSDKSFYVHLIEEELDALNRAIEIEKER